jgi:hypothetical protein
MMMKNALTWLLLGVLALMSLKLVGAVLAALLPFAILSLLLAIPVGFVILVGWGASALLRGLLTPAR